MSDGRLIHGTAVCLSGAGVLLAGPSGAGKSDLALRLIDRGALLVADDQVLARREDNAVVLRCPDRIAGRMEVRGLGIVEVEHIPSAPLRLWIDLKPERERLPERVMRKVEGVAVPRVAIDPRFPSAPIKVEWALARLGTDLT